MQEHSHKLNTEISHEIQQSSQKQSSGETELSLLPTHRHGVAEGGQKQPQRFRPQRLPPLLPPPTTGTTPHTLTQSLSCCLKFHGRCPLVNRLNVKRQSQMPTQ